MKAAMLPCRSSKVWSLTAALVWRKGAHGNSHTRTPSQEGGMLRHPLERGWFHRYVGRSRLPIRPIDAPITLLNRLKGAFLVDFTLQSSHLKN